MVLDSRGWSELIYQWDNSNSYHKVWHLASIFTDLFAESFQGEIGFSQILN